MLTATKFCARIPGIIRERASMSDCKYLTGCSFYKENLEGSVFSSHLKNTYCKDDFLNCSRLLLRHLAGKERVPSEMFPNDKDRAIEIIRSM